MRIFFRRQIVFFVIIYNLNLREMRWGCGLWTEFTWLQIKTTGRLM
jgi:hypothetical protein